MKILKLFFTLIFLLAHLSSCIDWEDRKALSDINRLRQQYPDSALFLLDVAFHPRLMSDKLVAEWCMINGDLRDSLKSDMDIDTAYLHRAVLYYKKKEQPVMQAKAGFYLARACLEYDDFNRATTVYKEALEQALQTKEYNLTGYISSYLADLYEEEWSHEESAKLYKQAASFFLKANNIRSYGIALRDRGGVYVAEGDYDRALKLYQEADSIANKLKDTVFMSSMANYKGILFKEKGQYNLAESLLYQSINLDTLDVFPACLALSDLYLRLKNTQKAFDILKGYNKNEDIYTQSAYYNQKYKLFKSDNQVDSALNYLENHLLLYDSIWTLQNGLYISEIAKKYDYSKMEDDNIKLSRRGTSYLVSILFLALLITIFYIIYNRKLARKNIELARADLELNRQTFELEKEKLLSQQKGLELKQQENEFAFLRKKEVLTKQSLLKRSLTFKKIQMLSTLKTNNPEAFKQEVERLLTSYSLSEQDWEEIKSEINFVYSGFTTALAEKLPRLTEEEIRFCCLLKAGLDTSELATLLNINPTSVDRRRTRINKKIQELYPDLSWRDFLNGF